MKRYLTRRVLRFLCKKCWQRIFCIVTGIKNTAQLMHAGIGCLKFKQSADSHQKINLKLSHPPK